MKKKHSNPNKHDMDGMFKSMEKMHSAEYELENMAKHIKMQAKHLKVVGSPFKRGR